VLWKIVRRKELSNFTIFHPNWLTLEALSPGVKWPGREANHSPPSSREIKNTPLYVFMAYGLIKHRIRLHGMVLS
jgi:hypothetical protein